MKHRAAYRQQPRHAPQAMTVAHNRTMAFSKIDTAPLHMLDKAMVESIARTHRVSVGELQQRLAERQKREAAL